MSGEGERLDLEAADWLVRLQSGDAGDDDLAELTTWLEASPEHGRAYARAEALWAELDGLKGTAVPAPARLPPRRFSWVPYAGAALAAGLAAVAVLAVQRPAPPEPAQVYATAKGQSRALVLADGSKVQLNSGSEIRVRLGRRERSVELADGEAAFDVAHDTGRPFVVSAGDREVRVLGTEFDVLRYGGKLAVTVRRGVVEVRPPAAGGASGDAVRLTPGQQLVHREGGDEATVQSVDPAIAFAWKSGDLVYRDQALGDVVADLNRYFAVPLRVQGPAAELRFTGLLKLDEEDAVVRRLQAFLPIAVDRSPEAVTLRLQVRGD
jgi:transmembrane sensor